MTGAKQREVAMTSNLNRRAFNRGLVAAGVSALAPGAALAARPGYRGPKVIIVRFGGGVRRRETIDPLHSYSPFLIHELAKRGVLFPEMQIADHEGVVTSHGHGTLYTLTGKYEAYEDAGIDEQEDRPQPGPRDDGDHHEHVHQRVPGGEATVWQDLREKPVLRRTEERALDPHQAENHERQDQSRRIHEEGQRGSAHQSGTRSRNSWVMIPARLRKRKVSARRWPEHGFPIAGRTDP